MNLDSRRCGEHSTDSEVVGAISDGLFGFFDSRGADTDNGIFGEKLLCMLEFWIC